MKIWKLIGILLLWSTIQLGLHAQQEQHLTFLGQFNPYPTTGYNDCWGFTAPDGREYALLGVKNGTSVVDITDPSTPREIDFIPSNFSTWKDIKVYKNYAYVVVDASGDGMQIVDLSALPQSVTLVNTYTGSGFSSSHNIFIDETAAILYAQNGSGVRVISLANPLEPEQLSIINIGNIHDVFAQDGVLYVSEGWSATYSLWDVQNPAEISFIVRFNTPTNGYAHNAWATTDGHYLLTTEEVPQGLTLKVWDIMDTGNITLSDEYIASANGRPHNVHIKGDYAYVAHYWDGLRILDISNPADVYEVAFYDTYPGSVGGYNGNWGAFPYFNSGKILASDITHGLLIFYFDGALNVETQLPGEAGYPADFHLAQNYPNPFNPTTDISFQLSAVSDVDLSIYDVLGRKVLNLVNEQKSVGKHIVRWDGRDAAGKQVSSGIYMYRLDAVSTSSQFTQVRKMMLLQ